MRMKYIFLVIATISFLLETLGSSRSSFGEECSKIRKCDRKAWLYCYDGACDCSKREEMFYDDDKGKCVTKSGERCKYGGEGEDNGEGGLVEITDCVDHSECGEDGICVCDTKYHEVFNGTCELSKLFGDICSDEDKCSKFLHLHCINGSCDCKEEFSTYSIAEGQCVGALLKNCIDGKCLDGAECIDNKCICDIDHYGNSSDNTCELRKGFNENCRDDSECIHKGLINLECTNGKCDCEEGLKYSNVQKSEYSKSRDRYNDIRFIHTMTGPFVELCAPLIGNHCPNGYCAPNSKCKIPANELQQLQRNYRYDYSTSDDLFLNSRNAVCECEENLVPSKDKTKCGKKWMDGDGYEHGQRKESYFCTTNEECVNNLVCYKSRCKCPSTEHQKINSALNYCLVKFGGPCSANSDCVANSFCNFLPNTTVGHCHCRKGFLENNEGECDGSHGTACDYEEDIITCDKAADLVCTNRKCSCKDEIMYKYSATLRKCEGLVGARCYGKNACVDNAECFQQYSELILPGRCKCKRGYGESSNFTCEPIPQVEL